MRITKISVKGLFGMFDHEIPLNQESRITILHGPNGVGKTVLMRMLHGLFHEDYDLLTNTPFDIIEIEFASEKVVSVERIPEQSDLHIIIENRADSTRIEFLLPQYPQNETDDGGAIHLDLGERLTEFVIDMAIRATRKIVISLFGIKEERQQKENREIPREYKSIVESTKPKLIREGRLWSRVDDSDEQSESTMRNASGEVYEPGVQRSSENMRPSRRAAINRKLQKRKRGVESGRQNIHDSYEQILNELLLYKTLKIDRSIVFRPDEPIQITGDSGNAILEKYLSSGEQHLLVMFQELLQAKPGTLVMIDEPELSLHVVWQRRFLELVEGITQSQDIDVLVATHSPQIISDNWDWMVALGEFEGEYDEETA